MGNEHARLQCLIPDDVAYDFAMNVFTFDPGVIGLRNTLLAVNFLTLASLNEGVIWNLLGLIEFLGKKTEPINISHGRIGVNLFYLFS